MSRELNPSGLCMCGCGGKAPIADITNRKRGYVAGKPRRFIAGHQQVVRRISTDQHLRRYVAEDRGHDTPCWIWQGTRTVNDYGQLRVGNRSIRAHRFFYEQMVGSVPDGLVLDHLCRVHACVNPKHLEPVTDAENVRRGSLARLTTDDAIAIVQSSMPAPEAAARFGVSVSQVYSIRNGSVWTDVTREFREAA
jgi:hypothetical protein